MKLDENYSIAKEGNCVTLYYSSKRYDEKKKKEVLSKDSWYFNNTQMALKKYVNEVVDVQASIGEVLVKLAELESKIDNLIL